jgi:hypothetical protein
MNSTAPIITTFTTKMMGTNLFAFERGLAATTGAASSFCAMVILQQTVQQAACRFRDNDLAEFRVSGH